MHFNPGWRWLLCSLLLAPSWNGNLRAAAPSDANALNTLKTALIRNYAVILHAEYEDSLAEARNLQTAISRFVDKPLPVTLAEARRAWVASRNPYLQTEVGRFYDGPIEAIEGFINAWPVDENYIDYTEENKNAGLVNQPDLFPKITGAALIAANEKDGEKNVSTGFHAIEFLLWGQALHPQGPGERPYTDYLPDARNSARRAQALRVMVDLLIEQLGLLEREWRENIPGNYRSRFLARPPDEALANILNGLGNFSGTELSGERLLVPYTTKDRKSQHSCFSDVSCLDLVRGEIGIQNIYLGRYQREHGNLIKGPGLNQLLDTVDSRLSSTLKEQIQNCVEDLRGIPPPFEEAISGLDSDPGRMAVKRSLDALQAQTKSLAAAAKALGLRLNLR